MISKALCPAKWTHVSIKLQTGEQHSCHYPPTHFVPIQEIERDPHAFHTSKHKKQQQKLMLRGQRPRECSYCWSLEDKELASPRLRHLEQHPDLGAEDGRLRLRYLEVSFSTRCQLKCSYCNAQTSSSIAEEVKRFGPYLYERATGPHPQAERYRAAFWPWFDEVYTGLEDLRVTGGEPFLDPDFDKLLHYLEANPHPRLKLSINSNLSLPRTLFTSFLRRIERLIRGKFIASCTYFTSLDAWGEQGTYLRYGLDLDKWDENVRMILQHSASHIIVTNTFNVLSMASNVELVKQILTYDQKRVRMDYSRLVHPSYMAIDQASSYELSLLLQQQKELMAIPSADPYVEALNIMIEYVRSVVPRKKWRRWLKRHSLSLFLHEYDRRKGLDFQVTFPHLKHLKKPKNGSVVPIHKFLNKLWKLLRTRFPKLTRRLYY